MPADNATAAAVPTIYADFGADPTHPNGIAIPDRLAATLDRLATGSGGTEDQADSSGQPDKERAAAIIRTIGMAFVESRKSGRSIAWAELEDSLMTNAHVIVAAGMMSPKDWIGLAIDIEDFRKQETGTQKLPADFLAEWLSQPADIEPEPVVRQRLPRVRAKVKKTGKKAKATTHGS